MKPGRSPVPLADPCQVPHGRTGSESFFAQCCSHRQYDIPGYSSQAFTVASFFAFCSASGLRQFGGSKALGQAARLRLFHLPFGAILVDSMSPFGNKPRDFPRTP